MYSPKEYRQRLFWQSEPEVRFAEPHDLRWVRLAQKMSGVEMNEDEFAVWVQNSFGGFQETLVIEDDNNRFGAGRGPVAVIGGTTDGYLYLPQIEWFPWATPKNKLRSSVEFFQRFRKRKLGVIRIHAQDKDVEFCKRLKKYVPLYFVGRIPGGTATGDDNIYYLKCRSAKYGNN